jgi:Sulfotransferase domain
MPTTRATFYAIEGIAKQMEVAYAERSDFLLGVPEAADSRRIVDEPGWSPYCIDADRRELLFVRLPPDLDLSRVPFWEIAQLNEGQALMAVPLDDALLLAASLPDPETIVLIFSIGRCGTTLMSHALNGSPRTFSVSEPGVFNHRPLRQLTVTGNMSELIRALMRLCHATRPRKNETALAVKLRSQAIFTAGLFWRALPQARHIFMYRDAISWGNSFLQFLIDVGVPMPPDAGGRAFHWMMTSADRPLSDLARFIDLDERPIGVEATLAPSWVVHLEEYRWLLAAGMPFLALRYNEFVKDREASLARVFDYCGLSLEGVDAALDAFAEDSQKGTSIERKADKTQLTPAQEASYRKILAIAPTLADADIILPDATTAS